MSDFEPSEIFEADSQVIGTCSNFSGILPLEGFLEMKKEWINSKQKKSCRFGASLEYSRKESKEKDFPMRVHMISVVIRIQGRDIIDIPSWGASSFEHSE